MNNRQIKKQLRAIYDATEIERYYPPKLYTDDTSGIDVVGSWWYENDNIDPTVHYAKPVSGKRIKWLSHMIMRFGTPYECNKYYFNSRNCRHGLKYIFECVEDIVDYDGWGDYELFIVRVKPMRLYEKWLLGTGKKGE